MLRGGLLLIKSLKQTNKKTGLCVPWKLSLIHKGKMDFHVL